MSEVKFTVKKIREILRYIKTNKTSGLDEVPVILLKNFSPILTSRALEGKLLHSVSPKYLIKNGIYLSWIISTPMDFRISYVCQLRAISSNWSISVAVNDDSFELQPINGSFPPSSVLALSFLFPILMILFLSSQHLYTAMRMTLRGGLFSLI